MLDQLCITSESVFVFNDTGITKIIFLWDRHICCNTWSSEMYEIVSDVSSGTFFVSRVRWMLQICVIECTKKK